MKITIPQNDIAKSEYDNRMQDINFNFIIIIIIIVVIIIIIFISMSALVASAFLYAGFFAYSQVMFTNQCVSIIICQRIQYPRRQYISANRYIRI